MTVFLCFSFLCRHRQADAKEDAEIELVNSTEAAASKEDWSAAGQRRHSFWWFWFINTWIIALYWEFVTILFWSSFWPHIVSVRTVQYNIACIIICHFIVFSLEVYFKNCQPTTTHIQLSVRLMLITNTSVWGCLSWFVLCSLVSQSHLVFCFPCSPVWSSMLS